MLCHLSEELNPALGGTNSFSSELKPFIRENWGRWDTLHQSEGPSEAVGNLEMGPQCEKGKNPGPRLHLVRLLTGWEGILG